MNEMERIEVWGYEAPSVVLYECVVEAGFGLSGSTTDDIGDYAEEESWT